MCAAKRQTTFFVKMGKEVFGWDRELLRLIEVGDFLLTAS